MKLNSLLILHGVLVILGAIWISVLISAAIFYVPGAMNRIINKIKEKRNGEYDE